MSDSISRTTVICLLTDRDTVYCQNIYLLDIHRLLDIVRCVSVAELMVGCRFLDNSSPDNPGRTVQLCREK